ncbi:class I SAM-dependent methyltransferase [Ahrensia sp. R2A130]|uniref:class I SAM-dependent methyltransferase n=1 Tax=Ahrensia sp. R2A130 TaxID=744979 RepID=UPI0001E0D8AF|nr:class I SAM-dependent methyltransferase [Ahrensia sp. R2A130]EFL87719.1 C-methyltransferase [Ahrensia sp. R2A130]
MTNLSCRACGKTNLKSLIDVGMTPLSNAMVPFARADEGEVSYPLHAFTCQDCFLVQLGEFQTPQAIFAEDYVYFSSFSTSWLEHAKRYAVDQTARFDLGPDAHISEVASNDGYLLRWFADAGQKVTGIEPADGCAEAARKVGVHTEQQFFGRKTARAVAASRGKADLMAANNVLAHVPDLDDFTGGFAEMLKPEGVVTFEFPHLLNMMRYNQFDTIYHEHFSYLALRPVMEVLAKNGLRVFDVQEWPTHGGSLRVFACHEGASHDEHSGVAEVLAAEEEYSLYDITTYETFGERVRGIKDGLLSFLIEARRKGETVAAYGAAAKGSTLLNYCGVGTEYVSYVVDRNPNKQNRFMPGIRIPTYGVEHMQADNPDHILILPWNLRDEIMAQLRHEGLTGDFVTAIPELTIVK